MSTGEFAKARLERMHDVMASYVERGVVPGIVTLVSRRGETHVDAIGTKAFGGSDPQTYGRDGGYGTSWYVDPKEEVIGILMTKRVWGSPSPPGVLLDFWTSAYPGDRQLKHLNHLRGCSRLKAMRSYL